MWKDLGCWLGDSHQTEGEPCRSCERFLPPAFPWGEYGGGGRCAWHDKDKREVEEKTLHTGGSTLCEGKRENSECHGLVRRNDNPSPSFFAVSGTRSLL